VPRIKQNPTDLLADNRPAGVAQTNDIHAATAEPPGQQLHLRTFSAAVGAVENYELSC
jgi:hypothetical protein